MGFYCRPKTTRRSDCPASASGQIQLRWLLHVSLLKFPINAKLKLTAGGRYGDKSRPN